MNDVQAINVVTTVAPPAAGSGTPNAVGSAAEPPVAHLLPTHPDDTEVNWIHEATAAAAAEEAAASVATENSEHVVLTPAQVNKRGLV